MIDPRALDPIDTLGACGDMSNRSKIRRNRP